MRTMSIPTRLAVAATLTLGLATVPVALVAAQAADRPWMNTSLPAQQRAHLLVDAMRLSEKVTFLHGVDQSLSPVPTVGYIPPIRRLDTPAITMTDGPAGVRNGQKATELPAPIAQAASFDPSVARSYGGVVGGDARDLGQRQVFGPGMNIDRVPTNGRNFEYFSEDPYLSGTIAGANVQGIQHQDVVATVKHYVANNQETNRTSVSANVDDRTLHEIYEKNFGIAIADGHPGSVMCSYNRINDVYSCSNRQTLITALRQQFGFDGYVVSDYPATHSVDDIAAGLNVELPTGVNITLPAVKAALAAHTITMADIDARVGETLTVLFRFGFFDHPQLPVQPINERADNRAAQSIEERSAVLLKNDGALPFTSATKKIAVVGTIAKTSRQGGGSSQVDPLSIDNAYDAIVSRAGSGASVTYNDGSDPAAAADAARGADTALVFVGDESSEGSDRSTLALSGNQDDVVSAVAAANPHTVVVMETGAPALLPWLSKVSGVLEAWYPGARGGAAIARLLWGDVNPSGKLPQTWPVSDAQVPASTPEQYPGVNGEETYSEGVDVGYRWYDAHDQTPLFPFGYGLSYTHFDYSGLTLRAGSGTSDKRVVASVTVTNTGGVTGAAVPQLYVSKPDRLTSTPPRELAQFGKVTLAPGQSRQLSFTVDPRELAYWDTDAQAFTVQSGTYTFAVGDSSRSLPLSTQYTVTKSTGPVRFHLDTTAVTAAAGSSFDASGTVDNLSDYSDTGVQASVQAPSGWTAAVTTAPASTLAPGASTPLRVHVTIPTRTVGGRYTVTVTTTGTVHGRAVTSSHDITVTVPFASLPAAYDTVGLTHDANPAPGNWDPAGYSYSAQGLATQGIVPGGPVTVDGATATFPSPAPGTPDAITARGQVIEVGAQTDRLVIVGAATYGEVADHLTVTYTDGSTASVPVDFADWYSNAPAAGSSLVATTHWNSATGADPHDVSIYGSTAAVDGSKTIATITLPVQANLHFFVIAPAG